MIPYLQTSIAVAFLLVFIIFVVYFVKALALAKATINLQRAFKDPVAEALSRFIDAFDSGLEDLSSRLDTINLTLRVLSNQTTKDRKDLIKPPTLDADIAKDIAKIANLVKLAGRFQSKVVDTQSVIDIINKVVGTQVVGTQGVIDIINKAKDCLYSKNEKPGA